MEKDIAQLVQEHEETVQREQQLKEEIVDTLTREGMTDFFTVNWRKLNNVFGKNPRHERSQNGKRQI